jgi:tetratricopeptide (TPR) repeat protein
MKNLFILFILFNAGLAFSQNGQLAKGNFYFDKEGYFEAITCYERVLGSEFDSPEMQKKLAYSYNFCGQFDKAEKLYKKLIGQKADAQLLYELGFCLARQNKQDEANAYFQQFAAANPTDKRAQLFLKDPGYLAKIMSAETHFKIEKNALNTDNEDFAKDLSTGALINKNKGALEKYRKTKEQSNKVANLESEIDNIKSELVVPFRSHTSFFY